MILPLFLIIIGIAFLLKNLGLISVSAWGVIWPALLIVLGLGILWRRKFSEFFLAPWESCFLCGKKKQDTGRQE